MGKEKETEAKQPGTGELRGDDRSSEKYNHIQKPAVA